MKRRQFIEKSIYAAGSVGLLSSAKVLADDRIPNLKSKLTSDDYQQYAIPKKYDISRFNLDPRKTKYSFVILADPQGGQIGHPSDEPGRLPKTDATIEKVLKSINGLSEKIDFCIVDGDIVDFEGQIEHYEVMHNYLSQLNMPVFYEAGNHETPYVSSGCVFRRETPEENFGFLSNYIFYQKKMSGINRVCYSFDAGKVHFLIIPNLIRDGFWKTYPHLLDWVDQDLAAHQHMPVMVFHHSPVVPVGMEPVPGYSEDPSIKRRHLELFSKYGNVRYAISGHVHIPFKGSVKTSREYKGVKYLNLPPAGIYNRQIGEADYVAPGNGYVIVNVDGENIDLCLKHYSGKEFSFGKEEAFDPDQYKLEFYEDWELPANQKLLNSDFSQGLAHWEKYYIYKQDDVSYLDQKVIQDKDKGNAVRLYVAGDAPTTGTVCTFNQLSQMIDWNGNDNPVLQLDYLIRQADCGSGIHAGGLVRVEGYNGKDTVFKLAYWMGGKFFKPEHHYGHQYLYHHFDCQFAFDQWGAAAIQPADDIRRINETAKAGSRIEFSKADKLKVTLQVWSKARNPADNFGIHFSNVRLAASEHTGASIFMGQNPAYIGTKV